MKPKRKKNGFKITLCDMTYNVYFKIINNWKVICTIHAAGGPIYKGVAKCHCELDTFVEADGKTLAFERAVEKMYKHMERFRTRLSTVIEKEHALQTKGLEYRFTKMLKSGEI